MPGRGRDGGLAALGARWVEEPYLRGEHAVGSVVTHRAHDDALVAVIDSPGRDRGLFGIGPAEGVAALLADLLTEPDATAGVRYASLTLGALEIAGEAVREAWGLAPDGSAWDWMWTGRPLVDADPEGAERLALTPAGLGEVADCLSRAHPDASTSPDDERTLGWWGARGSDGTLLAVVGAVSLGPRLPAHLVSLGVDPAARGQGLAGAVLAAAVRDCLAVTPVHGRPMVSLGLYAHNERARRVYLRHGFELRHRFASRRRVTAG